MGTIFFALFLLVPIIEIIGFIQIGSLIGLWPTIGIVILTAIAGSILLRHQGMAVLFQTQSKLAEGKVPMDQMIDGICLAMAGALLLTPGFFTDIFGFLLFIPPFRRGLVKTFFQKYILPNTTIYTNGKPYQGEAKETQKPQGPEFDDLSDGPIIDGEFQETDGTKTRNENENSGINHDKNKSANGSSPWNEKHK